MYVYFKNYCFFCWIGMRRHYQSLYQSQIFQEKGFEPSKGGIILAVGKKIYVHHYPVVSGALSPPSSGYSFTGGLNPYGMPSCTPTRISFFHFSTFTLAGIRSEVKKMDMPAPKKKEVLKAIDEATRYDVPKIMRSPSANKTRRWRFKYSLYLSGYAKQGKLIWGEDYALSSTFEKNKLFNSSSLPIK